MAESEFPSAAATASSTQSNRLVFRVVLRDAEGYEGLDSRTIHLPIGSTFPIGRASRNSTKQDLAPAANNAYIDSPVISREHAKLSAHAETGTPHVYVTDCRSMHGTMVNGQRLTPHVPTQLSAGDLLQFGVDVNRNEEFFVARKYIFEAHLDEPLPSFSQGFTVPDSDDELIAPEPLADSSRRGSQDNPVTLDESDSDSDASDIENETTMIAEGFTAAEVIDYDIGASSDDAILSEPLRRDLSIDIDLSGDDDHRHHILSAASVDELDSEDLDSGASLMGDSQSYDSDIDGSDLAVDGGSSDVAENQDAVEPEPSQTLPVPAQAEVSSIPPWAVRDFNFDSNPYDSTVTQPPPTSTSELPPMKMLRQTFDNESLNSFPPPLPPRPSTSNTSWFERGEHRSNFTSDTPSYPNYLGTNHGDRPSLFSPASLQNMVNAQEAESRAFFDSHSIEPAAAGNRIQTPPLMPTSDVTSSTPPQPGRRTMLSIDEIVEEQPPTPTSINSMKRKAEVLDVEEVVRPDQTALEDEARSLAALVLPESVQPTDESAQEAAVIAQRPKKQPRSIINRIRNTAAYVGYGAMGAAGAVALLTCLPDAFFQVN
ncbi:hypothetical protein FB567DRAFT_588159 [Paraphoma chrysanthemicola]|uniref:FHA domain-containing protein n=1 Tax=Paraphoma chrysanthemicola TaxID=798071 RepID=A0A8K0W3E4_9PLEO|nr:hypothetical protein FB567DRAFT_588159 [Paraphoma chrysanthemicola]